MGELAASISRQRFCRAHQVECDNFKPGGAEQEPNQYTQYSLFL